MNSDELNYPSLYSRLKSFYHEKTVLVTGSSGFKGTWLCKVLTLLGANVTGFSLEPPTNPSLFEICSMPNLINQHFGDIRDYSSLNAVFTRTNPELVFHLAAQPLVIRSYEDPLYTYETNVMGTINVLECARKNNAVTSLLNVTTDKVYLNTETKDYLYKEDDSLDGFDPYSNSKSCSELATHSYVNSFFSPTAHGAAAGRCAVSTARAGNVIGGGDFADNRIIPDCARAAIAQESLTIRNPNSIRPYQHVLEPIVAYLIIAAKQHSDYTLADWYNIGPNTNDCVTTLNLVQMFQNSWGRDFTYHCHHTEGPHEANFLMLDNSKISRQLGWTPTWDIKRAVDETAIWFKEWANNGNRAASECVERQILSFFGV